MSNNCHRPACDERCHLRAPLSGGLSIRGMGRELNRSQGTISRGLPATLWGAWLPSRAGTGQGPHLAATRHRAFPGLILLPGLLRGVLATGG